MMANLPYRTLAFLILLGGSFFGMACGKSTSQVIFMAQSTSPGQDGSFINRCCGFTVKPKSIFLVMGDMHLLREAPTQSVQVFPSLSPLLTPGDPEPQPEEIGKDGKFPTMWAINITRGASIHKYPTGFVESGTWKQLQLRISPAGSTVRGTSSVPAISGKTLLMEGSATRDQLVCNFRLSVSFELGLGLTINFPMQPNLVYRHTLEVDYSSWFDDVAFQSICPKDVTQTLEITNASQPQIIENIKNAIPKSITVKIGAGTAE